MVRPKKHLGQHFLTNEEIAASIATSLLHHQNYKRVLEIGPGMGVLTKYLLEDERFELDVVELDRESVAYLKENFPSLGNNILEKDFLQLQLDKYYKEPFAVIGNFPYNISSQILFKVLDYKDLIPEVCGMFQKEVAERIASGPGNKTYGILSVLLQAFYTIEYLFTVEPEEFNPPPKVRSGVIRLLRNETKTLDCDEKLFKQVVKTSFGQRRKTLRNSLKAMLLNADEILPEKYSSERPEQLVVEDFIEITKLLQVNRD